MALSWKRFLFSTTVVGLAEIGDKTQILSLKLAARFQRPVPIIFGILFATIANPPIAAIGTTIETVRPDQTRQLFSMRDRGDYLESIEEIPEPHEFTARVSLAGEEHTVVFEEHEHAHRSALRDNNMRSAVIHVMADATASILVIVGLLLARAFGWIWMDPLAGIIGSCVIASWSYGLIRDTGAILLDMNPDRRMADNLRQTIEAEGDTLGDLHLWRLGPGHLGAIVSVITKKLRGPEYYRAKLARFRSLSHLTIQVEQRLERQLPTQFARAPAGPE
jgi:hypothetical protein